MQYNRHWLYGFASGVETWSWLVMGVYTLAGFAAPIMALVGRNSLRQQGYYAYDHEGVVTASYLVAAIVCAGVGWVLGYLQTYLWRLVAQLVMCLAQIEENTRAARPDLRHPYQPPPAPQTMTWQSRP